MIVASVARRYARALLALGLDEHREEQFGAELASVLQVLETSREAGFFLKNPGYALAQRHAALDAVAQALHLSPTVLKFLRLLVDRQRIADLAQIARAYAALVDAHAGRVRATVVSAAPLPEKELKRLGDAIAAITGRTILLDAKTDPALLGGVVTQVGATQFDGSLRTQLERMREALKSTPI